MVMQGGAFAGCGPDESQIEVFDRGDRRRERRVLSHAGSDDIKNLALAARNQAVNESLAAGFEVLEARRAFEHLLVRYSADAQSRNRSFCGISDRSHFVSPVSVLWSDYTCV